MGDMEFGRAPVRERADAARNRAKILAAASRLFEEKGVDEVSMDQIASEAQVGKGTLFRRFGDKAGLAAALLDTREHSLQMAILRGGPPLGPGASPTGRLVAFFVDYVLFLEANLDLVHLSETASPGSRYRVGAYHFWHQHVRVLLTEARPDMDAGYMAHALLAAVAADLRKGTREAVSIERVVAGVRSLVTAVAGQSDRGPIG
jgi:AcrR family transcriptional regulator